MPKKTNYQLAIAFGMIVGIVGCQSNATMPKSQSAASNSPGTSAFGLQPKRKKADLTVSQMPLPPGGLVDTGGQCNNSSVAFVSDSAKQNAGWLNSRYDSRLMLWAQYHFGERAEYRRSDAKCSDGGFAARAWQTTIGVPVTGTLSDLEAKRLVDIVDQHEPEFVAAKNKIQPDVSKPSPAQPTLAEMRSELSFVAFGFALGEPLNRPWCNHPTKPIAESCWNIQSGNVWGYLAGQKQEPPGRARGHETGLLRLPKGTIPFSNANTVNVDFQNGILTEVFIDFVFRDQKDSIAMELRRIFGAPEPTDKRCVTRRWVDQFGNSVYGDSTICGIGNDYKSHHDGRTARLSCITPDRHCQLTLRHSGLFKPMSPRNNLKQ